MSAIHLTWGDLPPALFPLIVAVLSALVITALEGSDDDDRSAPVEGPKISRFKRLRALFESWKNDFKDAWGATKLCLRGKLPTWIVASSDWLWKERWHGVSVAGFLVAFGFVLAEVIWHGWDGVQADDALWYLFTVVYLWTWLGYSAVSHLSTGIRYVGAAVGGVLSLSIVLGLVYGGLPTWPVIVILVFVFAIGAVGSAANRSRWGMGAMVLAYGLFLVVRGMVWLVEQL